MPQQPIFRAHTRTSSKTAHFQTALLAPAGPPPGAGWQGGRPPESTGGDQDESWGIDNVGVIIEELECEAQVEALALDNARLRVLVAALQGQVEQLNAEKQALAQQVSALADQNQRLQGQLEGVAGSLAMLTEDLRNTMNDPSFTIPGSTVLEKEQNLIEAVVGLHHGPKQLLYRALGGRK